MSPVARTNRLYQLVGHQLELLQSDPAVFPQRLPALLLLLEQWLIALCREALPSIEELPIYSLDQLIDAIAGAANVPLVCSQVGMQLSQTGNWLNDMLLARQDYLASGLATPTRNLIASSSQPQPYPLWVANIERLMNDIREFNREC